jgi:integrase
MLLLLLTGLRVGSAVGARVEDLGTDRGHRTLDVVVKRGHRRRIPLPPVLGTALDAMLAARGNPVEGPLFLAPSGVPLYELAVHRLLRRLARGAGIPAADRLSPHSLRHTAITELLDATNGDLRRAQDFAGHADPRTTRRYDRNRHQLDGHGAYLLAGRYDPGAPVTTDRRA